MDDKKSILENPMVELIRAVLEAVRDFSYENVFRYLKTGLVYDRAEGTADEAQPVWENAAGADSGGEAIDWEEASDGELADVLLGETGGGADRRYSREEAAVMTDRLEKLCPGAGN